MAVGAVVARILTQYSDKGSKQAQKDIAKMGKNFDAFAKKVTKAFAVAGAAVAAFAIKVGKDAVQAAIADQKSQILLANSLRNTTGATNAAIASVEAYISKLQLQVGVADDELRPSLAKLAAVTGSVTDAQQLLGVALDVSAFSGSDLGTATNAITRALQGNFRSLQKLVPSLDAATLKSKDFAAILAEVQKATTGAAAARAGTLEYKLNILRIRFNEILETLGYALLPVIETFADTLQKKVLPQIEKWIKENKQGLVNGLEAATKFMVKLVMAALSFSEWISNNMGLVKALAIVIASLWATAKIISFVLALKSVAIAFGLITVSANGATVATARFIKTASFLFKFGKLFAGILAVLGLSGSSATGAGGFPKGTVGALMAEGDTRRGSEKSASAKLRGRNPRKVLAPTITDSATGSLDALLAKLTTAQNKLNNGKTKELKIEDAITKRLREKYGITLMTSEIEAKATAYAIEQNLKRQAAIAKGSPTVSLATQGDGSNKGGTSIMGSGNPNVGVYINTTVGTAEDFTVKIANELNTRARREGVPIHMRTR